MKNGFYLSLAAVVFGLVAWRAPVPARGTSAAAQTWEYRIVKEGDGGPGPKVLNALGAQGWDLASVVCTEHTGGGTAACWYYMKRAK